MAQLERSTKGAQNKWNLGVLLSHPIQYHVPLMRRLASQPSINLTVLFMSDTGIREKHIRGYGETIKWDVPLLDGYTSQFLRNYSPRANTDSFWSRFNPGIIPQLRRRRFDALMLHGYSSPTEWLALLGAFALGIPILMRGEVVLRSPRKHFPPVWLKEKLLSKWCRRITAALAINSAAVRFYEHYGVKQQRIFWAPSAVDNEFWISKASELAPNKTQLKRELELHQDLPVILFVAHMRANKRPLDLVKAFQRIRTPASLVLVGGGPLFSAVRQYCSANELTRVHLPGAKNQTELPKYYAVADVFVLPSEVGEVSPLVINEAMCFGLPIILSDAIPSAPDFVSEAQNGYMYEVGNNEELAQRIDAVIENPNLGREMGNESLRAIAAWNYDSTVGAILEALASIGVRTKQKNAEGALGFGS